MTGATVDLAPSSATFAAAVTLTPAEPEHFDLAFTAITQPCPWPKAYGGDMVAQALAAAMRSVTDGKTLHSTHSYFLRPVDIGAPVRYEVELLRDGRGYSTRQVRGYQNGKPVYVALASFAAGEPGAAFAAALPEGIPGPDGLPSSADYLDGLAEEAAAGTTMTERSRTYWPAAAASTCGTSPARSTSPSTVSASRTRRSGSSRSTPCGRSRGSPTSSAIWRRSPTCATTRSSSRCCASSTCRGPGPGWSRPASTMPCGSTAVPAGALDDWVLYLQEAVAAEAGRGLATGRFFTRDHRHLATVVQEGMIRTS